MQEQAIEKLQAELQANPAPYLQVIGEYLIRHVAAMPEAAEKILAERKTIEGAFQAIVSEAERRARGEGNNRETMVVFTDQQGLEIALAYFEIGGGLLQEAPVSAKRTAAANQKKPAKKVVQFPGTECVQTTLDDFLNESEVISE